MKKKTSKVKMILPVIGVAVAAYFLGLSQSGKEAHAIMQNKYVALDECIPLEDISCYHTTEEGDINIELRDIRNQLDNPSNHSYMDILGKLDDISTEYEENYIDMRDVTNFCADSCGLQLYLEDGTGYYWEKGEN